VIVVTLRMMILQVWWWRRSGILPLFTPGRGLERHQLDARERAKVEEVGRDRRRGRRGRGVREDHPLDWVPLPPPKTVEI
jgi:hypothetical protein